MSEAALCEAVRDEIRAHAAYQERQIDVELDEIAPPTAGDLYILVIPAGSEPGPSHNTNAGAIDRLYAVDVAVAMRAPMVPRDRRRRLFLDRVRSYQLHERNILSKIDFQYAVNTSANALISANEGSTEGFIEPLKFAGTGPFRTAPADLFAAGSGETVAAVIRRIHFRGARRIETRS